MTIYEANRKIKEKENELKYLNEAKQLAFESTQPKAMKVNEVSVQSSHKIETYTRLDYSIDEIEPKIELLEKELNLLKEYVNNYYEILKQYEPEVALIIRLREEHGMSWEKISEVTNYSERSCRYKFDEYKKGGKTL